MLWVMVLWTKLVWYQVLAFVFIRVLDFDEGGLPAKSLRLRHLLH